MYNGLLICNDRGIYIFIETINGIELVFETSESSFSPQRVDRGTLAMLSVAEFSENDKVLDLGCGYGVVGIYAAKLIGGCACGRACVRAGGSAGGSVDGRIDGFGRNVFMSDIDASCVEMSKNNAAANNVAEVHIILSDGFKNIQETDFTLILSNPPYQVDFSVPKHFIEKGFNHLRIGGKMLMVTKRELWYKNKLTAIFGGVRITHIDGYHVFCAEKRRARYANAKPFYQCNPEHCSKKSAARATPTPNVGSALIRAINKNV